MAVQGRAGKDIREGLVPTHTSQMKTLDSHMRILSLREVKQLA